MTPGTMDTGDNAGVKTDHVVAGPESAPEPATHEMVGFGFFSLAVGLWKIRRRGAKTKF